MENRGNNQGYLDSLMGDFRYAASRGDRLAMEAALAQAIPTFAPSLSRAGL